MNPDKLMSINDLIKYLPDRPSKKFVYKLVNTGKIPFHVSGNKLIFIKLEIDGWLSCGGCKTVDELIRESGHCGTQKLSRL